MRESTIAGYRTDLKHVARSGIGRVKLPALRPEHIESACAGVFDRGGAVGSVAHLRWTLSAALNTAAKRGHIARNPVPLANMPRAFDEPELEPYDAREIGLPLTPAHRRRNGARWSLAFLGLRQGEVLGLRWEDVNLESGELRIRHALTWLAWKHSSDERRKRRSLVSGPRPARAAMGVDRTSGGRRADTDDWLELIAEAAVQRLLHDCRHSAATALLVLGADARVLMATMGWTSMALVQRYTHTVPELRRDIAERQGTLWRRAAAE